MYQIHVGKKRKKKKKLKVPQNLSKLYWGLVILLVVFDTKIFISTLNEYRSQISFFSLFDLE